jgi:MoaA/NifB/PqqE/SkfB family radical SAM enzyme
VRDTGPLRDSPLFGPPGVPEPVAAGRHDFADPAHAEFPPIVIVAVTNLCDMACIHCAHPVVKKSPGYRGAFMDPAIHSRIVEQTRPWRDRLWVFRYAADGESLLHPNFADFVEETKAAGIGPVDLTTNAMSLDEPTMRRLLQAPIDLIDVSLDALSRETYEKIRKRGKYDVVVANLRRLIELRDELGAPTRILTSIIRQSEAMEEVEAFQEFWGPHVDEVLVRGLNTDLGIVNVKQTYFRDIERWPCPQFWKRVTLNHLGEIRFCVEDWFNRGIVGNVVDHTIAEVWRSEAYQEFRRLHSTGRWNELRLCNGCQDWQHMAWDHGFEKAVRRALGGRRP